MKVPKHLTHLVHGEARERRTSAKVKNKPSDRTLFPIPVSASQCSYRRSAPARRPFSGRPEGKAPPPQLLWGSLKNASSRPARITKTSANIGRTKPMPSKDRTNRSKNCQVGSLWIACYCFESESRTTRLFLTLIVYPGYLWGGSRKRAPSHLQKPELTNHVHRQLTMLPPTGVSWMRLGECYVVVKNAKAMNGEFSVVRTRWWLRRRAKNYAAAISASVSNLGHIEYILRTHAMYKRETVFRCYCIQINAYLEKQLTRAI